MDNPFQMAANDLHQMYSAVTWPAAFALVSFEHFKAKEALGVPVQLSLRENVRGREDIG
jgi:hypothetical protein